MEAFFALFVLVASAVFKKKNGTHAPLFAYFLSLGAGLDVTNQILEKHQRTSGVMTSTIIYHGSDCTEYYLLRTTIESIPTIILHIL